MQSVCVRVDYGWGVSLLHFAAKGHSAPSPSLLNLAALLTPSSTPVPLRQGTINFCPSQVSAEAEFWEEQFATAVHEIFHALGFSASSWHLFRFPDGTPRTPRDADGQVQGFASFNALEPSL